jgi:hypothetical protein
METLRKKGAMGFMDYSPPPPSTPPLVDASTPIPSSPSTVSTPHLSLISIDDEQRSASLSHQEGSLRTKQETVNEEGGEGEREREVVGKGIEKVGETRGEEVATEGESEARDGEKAMDLGDVPGFSFSIDKLRAFGAHGFTEYSLSDDASFSPSPAFPSDKLSPAPPAIPSPLPLTPSSKKDKKPEKGKEEKKKKKKLLKLF